MRSAILLAASVLLATLSGCVPSRAQRPDSGSLPTADASRTSVDWPGVYRGTVPCADCAGIRTRIELRGDGRYSRSLVYLGRGEQPITDSGRFEWDDSGSRVTLGLGHAAQSYQVGENVLFHLDREGERIRGDLAAAYRLEKVMNDPRIENRRWELVELNGRPIERPAGRDLPYLELDAAESRVVGHASCNRFFGSYVLAAGDRIRFGSDMGSTRMACPELDREREFLAALAQADGYTLADGLLSLHRARMAPLARFREARGESDVRNPSGPARRSLAGDGEGESEGA